MKFKLIVNFMPIIHNYCITGKKFHYLNNLDINIILAGSESKNLNEFPNNWIKDNHGVNISNKNKNFGTLSSHFWLWKNKLKDFSDEEWIGINHYRRFWVKSKDKDINLSNLSENILREIPNDENFDVLLPEKIVIENLKLSKLIKKGFQNYIRRPSLLFNLKKISIELHFDLFHGYNYLSDAAKLLNENDQVDFENHIKNKNSFHQFQIFVSKKKIIENLYEKTFDWIFKCEKKFSNLNLTGYGKERLYDFLAERYFSFYFEKYTKIKIWPWVLIDKDKIFHEGKVK